MILILSNETDVSTSRVMEWIYHFGGESTRLNRESKFELKHVQLTKDSSPSFELFINGKNINWNQIDCVWFRRGNFKFSHPSLERSLSQTKERHQATVQKMNRHLALEKKALTEALHRIIKTKPHLGNRLNASINKLDGLMIAKQVGLSIPATLVTTRKSELLQFRRQHPKLITKGIQEAAFFPVDQEHAYGTYTHEVTDELINACPEYFFPSKFQEKLEKIYELRVFYLRGKCYSMVIFSQLDNQTSVDFRRYNYERPNRNEPYQLPQKIEIQINRFMQLMELESGSLDIVVTKNDDFFFLEVNPVGQFGMVSGPCNYYLEKEIAQCLVQNNLKN